MIVKTKDWTAEDIPALRRELAVAYEMLRAALPLARQKLLIGGVDLLDQEAYWNSYGALSHFVDPDEEDLNGPSGINGRIEELWPLGSDLPVEPL